MPAPLLHLTRIDKSFAGVHALCEVDLTVRAGTVHAIVGENGAGKSTLGKIIAGVHAPDSGSFEIEGHPVEFDSPRDALAAGVTIVAQEIALVGTRTVVENVYLGSEAHRGPVVKAKQLKAAYAELVKRTGINVPAGAVVQDLSIADQQKVEILRAIARDSRVIVMDEPTARLATHEAKALIGMVQALRDNGTTILYVSHFLEEVLEVADEITVLRDGRWIDTQPAGVHTTHTLVQQMIGRSLDNAFPDKPARVRTQDDLLEVRKLSSEPRFRDVSFSVHPGEIVAITGLVGSGRSEVLRTIFGADQRTGGEVLLAGQPVRYGHPSKAIAAGIAMIPESRKTDGLQGDASILHNVSLPHLRRFGRPALSARLERAAVGAAISRVGAKHTRLDQPVRELSGGNQQKVLFAKALLGEPRLLIADEPTRGVDVQAKRQIYDLLAELADQGLGVLIVSSEMEEVIGLANRVVIMRQGRVVGELADDEITEHEIALLAFGQAPMDSDPRDREEDHHYDH